MGGFERHASTGGAALGGGGGGLEEGGLAVEGGRELGVVRGVVVRRRSGGGAEYAAVGAGVERGRNEEGAKLHLRCGWVMQVSGVEAWRAHGGGGE